MIAKIEGTLEAVEGGTALVSPPGSGLTYKVQLPAFAAARLAQSEGETVTLYTFQFLESQNQGNTLLPRLAGFLSSQDQQFYELFVTCKGIGYRRALRVMTLSTDQIAAAIADRDLGLLQSLPEVGRRTAETIAATLRGKVDAFVSAATYGPTAQAGSASAAPSPAGGTLARQALEVLLTLGEQRTQAVSWIDQALVSFEQEKDARPGGVQELINRVYQLKAGQ